jgi:D-3-phosphoglycerate dehydrogenase / 2-oxoglutarate reductase
MNARPVIGVAKLGLPPELERALSGLASLHVDPSRSDLAVLDAAVASSHLVFDGSRLAAASRLAVVTHIGTAIHTDVAAATELGIPVLHNPGRNADSVAEHTIGLLLALVKGIPRSDAEIRQRRDWEVGADRLVTSELRGRTLGVVGFGAVGSRVARIASAGLGMRVIGCSGRPGAVAAEGYPQVGLDELLQAVDVVSLHAVVPAGQPPLIDGRRLKLLRPQAWLVNTARADVLDYDALADLLASGRLAGAALDTWPGHRADPTSPLIGLPNVVLTQHNAGLTRESLVRMAKATAYGLWEVLAGRDSLISRLANPQVWERRRRPGADPGSLDRPW